jgi:hypothetical protein
MNNLDQKQAIFNNALNMREIWKSLLNAALIILIRGDMLANIAKDMFNGCKN